MDSKLIFISQEGLINKGQLDHAFEDGRQFES